MKKIDIRDVQNLLDEENQEDLIEQPVVSKKNKPIEGGKLSSKINKITRDLIQSSEDKDSLKVDLKRYKR